MRKLTEYEKKLIKREERLILENNMQHFAKTLRNILRMKFYGADIQPFDRYESNLKISDDDSRITVNFSYTNDGNEWNCNFSFGINDGQYNCNTQDGRTVEGNESGRIDVVMQKLAEKAHNEIIASDNEKMRTGTSKRRF